MKLSHDRKSHFFGQCKNFIVKKRVERAMKSSHNFPLRLYFQFVQDKICLTGVFCMPVSFCGRGKAERFVKAAGGTCCISMRQGEPLFSRIRGSSQLRLSLSGRHRQQDSSSTAYRDIPFPDEARQRPPKQFFRPTQKKTYFQGLCSRVSSRPTDEARKSSAHKAPCF